MNWFRKATISWFVVFFSIRVEAISIRLPDQASAVLFDPVHEQTLYSLAADRVIYPASTTKLATALLALKKLRSRLEERIVITREMLPSVTAARKRQHPNDPSVVHAIEVGSSHMGLKTGEEVTIHDLLRGCLIVSANDASNALALIASGSYSQFMEELNAFLKEIGCVNTHFMNAHGLYHASHVSTVADLTKIACAVLQEPVLTTIVASKVFHRPATNKQSPALMHNTNRLLQPGRYFCRNAVGMKTGFTHQSGSTFVLLGEKEDRRLLLVIAGLPTLGESMLIGRDILEELFKEERIVHRYYAPRTILPYFYWIPGADKPVAVMNRDEVVVAFYPSQKPLLRGRVRWIETSPPVAKGQFVGELALVDEGDRVVATSALLAAESIERSWGFAIKKYVQQHPVYMVGLLVITWLVFRILVLSLLLSGKEKPRRTTRDR